MSTALTVNKPIVHLDIDDKYVECVNDCELISCANMESMNATSSCYNYAVTTIEDTITRGYIPCTIYCVNLEAQPEQRPGYVVKESSNELGNCYYDDGITLVNRTLSGDYAYCGGNDNAICNNTFEGGYRSFNYDPRFRDWYRNTKRSQTSIWTTPYFFAAVEKHIGITYTRPIYSKQSLNKVITDSSSTTDNNMTMNDHDHEIFHGVLAVDYLLNDINSFLLEEYSNSTMNIFLVERRTPNHMIASSCYNENKLTKSVLMTNESIACPINNQDDKLCTDVRVSIADLEQLQYDDLPAAIMSRAFIAHRDVNFPEMKNIYFKETDDIGSNAYISQMHSYTNSNLEWYIFVIHPMIRSTSDSSMSGTSMFYVVIFLASLGFIGCINLFIAFYNRRRERAMIYADWRFTCAFIMGCANLNLSSYTLLKNK